MKQVYPFDAVIPDWPAPENIVAFTSCRQGGFSSHPYDEFNLGMHQGDAGEQVIRNRKQLISACDDLQAVQWLRQVHGRTVVFAEGKGDEIEADAAYTNREGIACAVLTADCLPLLICDDQGQQVAAVHAGWRGLAAGVIEATISCFDASPDRLLVWLGPAISQPFFEVGDEVLQQFVGAATAIDKSTVEQAFLPNPKRAGHYFADLYGLARCRLKALGVTAIYGGSNCCYKDSSRFFSYRRDQVTGRMVSLIYRKP